MKTRGSLRLPKVGMSLKNWRRWVMTVGAVAGVVFEDGFCGGYFLWSIGAGYVKVHVIKRKKT